MSLEVVVDQPMILWTFLGWNSALYVRIITMWIYPPHLQTTGTQILILENVNGPQCVLVSTFIAKVTKAYDIGCYIWSGEREWNTVRVMKTQSQKQKIYTEYDFEF